MTSRTRSGWNSDDWGSPESARPRMGTASFTPLRPSCRNLECRDGEGGWQGIWRRAWERRGGCTKCECAADRGKKGGQCTQASTSSHRPSGRKNGDRT
eukprot:2969713-Rhodomonas_salina.1